MDREEIEEAIRELVEEGLIEDSGERSDGAVMWRVSEKGKDPQCVEQVLEALSDPEEFEEPSD